MSPSMVCACFGAFFRIDLPRIYSFDIGRGTIGVWLRYHNGGRRRVRVELLRRLVFPVDLLAGGIRLVSMIAHFVILALVRIA